MSIDFKDITVSFEILYLSIDSEDYNKFLEEHWDPKLWKALFDDYGLFLPNENEIRFSTRPMLSILDEMKESYRKSNSKRIRDLADNWDDYLSKKYDVDTLRVLKSSNIVEFFLHAYNNGKESAENLHSKYIGLIEDKISEYFKNNQVK